MGVRTILCSLAALILIAASGYLDGRVTLGVAGGPDSAEWQTIAIEGFAFNAVEFPMM